MHILRIAGQVVVGIFMFMVITGSAGSCVGDDPDDEPKIVDDKVVRGLNGVFITTMGTNNFYDEGQTAGATKVAVDYGSDTAGFDPDSGVGKHTIAAAGTPGAGLFSELGTTAIYQGKGANRIELTQIKDVGKDGESGDAFLMYSQQQAATGLEIGIGIGGTDPSPVSVIKAERAKTDNVATYNGTGSYMVGISHMNPGGPGLPIPCPPGMPGPCLGPPTLPSMTAATLVNTGKVKMVANFSGADAGKITGQIVNNVGGQKYVSGTGVVAGDEFDRVEFTARMNGKDSSAFEFDSLALKNNTTLHTGFKSGKFGGVGAFYGKKAGGTAFVFAGTGTNTGTNSTVNLVGGGYGER